MENLSLKGKVAIVTGSSQGLGEATAVLFASRQCSVVICGRDETRLAGVRQKCLDAGSSKDKVLTFAGDLKIRENQSKLIKKTIDTFGRLDILVNNAIDATLGTFMMIKDETLDLCNDSIIKMPIFLTQLAMPHLLQTKGCVINMSTMASKVPQPSAIIYSMLRAAADQMTKCLAIEYGPKGVRFNSISPGLMDTPSLNRIYEEQKVPKKARDAITHKQNQRHAMKRIGQPYEVAEVAAFLASDAAGFVTAQDIKVDGGGSFNFYPGYTGAIRQA